MTLAETLTGIGISGTLAVFAYWRHTRPHDKLKPRMIPWVIIALGATAFFFMLIIHLANVLGFETGQMRR